MFFLFFPGGACSSLASKWALSSLVSLRQLLPVWSWLTLTWGGCGPASLRRSKTRMEKHTSKTVSGSTVDHYHQQIASNKKSWCLLCVFPRQMWRLRNSPWASCAVQISPRWPGVWSTRWRPSSHAHATAQAGMPSCFGSLCPTSLHLCQTLLSICFFLLLKGNKERGN